MSAPDKVYLGDSVYVAASEGRGIVLTTENGALATNTIYLESEVIHGLLRYLDAVKSKST
jgi:hypothetical protein